MMKLFCIELSKLNKIELGEIVKRFQIKDPFNLDELYRLKMSGYNSVFIDEETNKMFFFTLNNAKRTIQVGDYLKNLLLEMKSLGFGARIVVNEHLSNDNSKECKKSLLLRENLSENEIMSEIERITSLINTVGFKNLTKDDVEFYKKYGDYI